MNRRPVGNPDRIFADSIKLKDLRNMSFDEVVDAYEKRVRNWYFGVSRKVLDDMASNFMLTTWCAVIIDFLSQYVSGERFGSKKSFLDFFKNHLEKKYNKKIKPIDSVKPNGNDHPCPERIASIPEEFYHGFRCGLVHSGRILEYGGVNRENRKNAFVVKKWKSGRKKGFEIQLNPVILFKDLEKFFKQYLSDLKKPGVLQNNFKKKFYWEYAIKL